MLFSCLLLAMLFSCLLLAMLFSCLLLAMLFSCLLLAMLFSCLLLAMLFSCLLLAMLFSLPVLQIGLRVSFAPVACCHATALLFVSFVCIFGRSSRLQCQLFVPVVLLVVLFSLRVSSALVFCLPEFDPLGSLVQVPVVLRHRAVLVLVACTSQARSTIWHCLLLLFHHWLFRLWFFLCSFFFWRRLLWAACSTGATLWWFTTVWSSVWYLQRHYSVLRHFVIIATTRCCATSWSLVRGRYSRVTMW